MSKPWYWSKTVWTNVGLLVLAVTTEASGWEFIPADWEAKLIGFAAFVNIWLRGVTDRPIRLKAEK